ncbi:MAG: TnpV protein [Ruminococcaceae bacterium]|nr:TnpV protein [Oscillospiraceae bacterium]
MNLPKYKTDERTGIKYELIGDYYFIEGDGEEPEDNRPIGRWGRMHEDYLKKNKRHVFDSMLMSGKLHSYLADIDEQARDMFDNLVEQIKESEGITEELKEQDQWEWVQRMENIQQSVREIVCSELIYV